MSVWRSMLMTGLICLAMPVMAVDQQQLLRSSGLTPFRHWDNLEGAPYWLAGEEPRYRRDEGLHTIRLKPGASSLIRLPAGQGLRLRKLDDPLLADELLVALSNGSALFMETSLRAGPDNNWNLLPDGAGDRLVRLSRPPGYESELEIAVFVSRLPELPPLARYRRLPRVEGEVARLQERDRPTAQPVWLTGPKQGVEVGIAGPQRLKLESWLRYRGAADQPRQVYRLLPELDGVAVPSRVHYGRADLHRRWLLDGCQQVLGRVQHAYIDIPEGRHRLKVGASAAVLLRLHGRPEEGDFLLPGNRPHPSAGMPPQTDAIESRLIDLGRLARDNRHSGTAALALDSAGRLAASLPLEPEPGVEAQALDGRHAFFRPLFPSSKPDSTAVSRLWPAKPRLRWDDRKPLLIPESLVSSLAKGGSARAFLTLPDRQDEAYPYPLPTRGTPSRLQLLVAPNPGQENQVFFLQFDQRRPRKLILFSRPPLPADEYWPDSAVAARVLSAGGSMAMPRVTEVADMELPLPADVSTIRLWQSAGNPRPVSLALGMRVAGRYAANEPEYRFMIDGLKPETHLQLLQQSLASIAELAKSRQSVVQLIDNPLANGSAAKRALLNDWLPLLRFLYSRYTRFVAMVEQPMPGRRSEGGGEDLPVQALRRQAEEAVMEQDWAGAVETWSAMLPRTSGEMRRDILMQRVTALKAMGEGYLAELLLRGMLIHEPDRALQEAAAEALALGYAKDRDDQGRVNLAVVRAILSPQPGRLAALAQALLKDGHPAWATRILLSLPVGLRPRSILLQSSYASGWWRTFESALQAIRDPQQQALWRGYRAQLFGDFDTALSAWAKAGSAGEALVTALQRGLGLRRQLVKRETPGEALLQDWADWWDQQPGERGWRSIDGSIIDFGGVEKLLVPDQDMTFQAFRALRDSPVKLTIQGPRRLRFIARPLHAGPAEVPIDDWLSVSDGSETWRFPINGDRTAKGVRLMRGSDLPGRAHRFEFSVGAGSHQLTLSPHHHPLLLRIEALSAERPLSVLPEPMLQGLSLQPVESTAESLSDPFPGQDVAWVKACPKAARHAETAESGAVVHDGSPPSAPAAGVPWQRLAARDEDYDKTYRQIAQWLWQAEQRPDRALAFLAQAEALFQRHAARTELQGMMRRLRRFAVWRPLDNLLSSAGQYYLQQAQFPPESPRLRVRSALLAPLRDGERWIYPGQGLGIALHNPSAPSTLILTFTLEELTYIDARHLTAGYRLNDGAFHAVHLTPGQPTQTLRVVIPPGRHRLRVAMSDPRQNQILRFGIGGEGGPGALNRERIQERVYQVATWDEPVELALEGPAWVRIDEADGRQTRSRYLFVEPGWRELRLMPRRGREQSLYRLFQQRPATAIKQSLPRERRLYQPDVMPVNLSPGSRLALAPVEDLLPLSGQEDGTWSYAGRLASRRNLDEDQGSSESERFLELGVTHRRFQQAADRYLQSGMLVRAREHGGPTLGINGRMRWQTGFRALTLALQGDLYLQQPKSDIGVEGAMVLRAELSQHRQMNAESYHRPTLSLFQRWLTLDRLPEDGQEEVDQDIYTPYKDDHQRGLRVGDTLTYYPWRDNRLRAGLFLTSNEALNPFDPDYTDLTLGADQLLGDLDLGLSYRWRHYFDDEDRRYDSNQHNLRLRLDWRRWSTPRRGWHLGLKLDHELDSGETSVFITLSHEQANGRFYRDYRPGTVAFEALRTRHELERHFSSSEAGQ